ncbi:hypothetical protein PG991_013246 [Apiospora marii]|uniref:Uncharacterized protein n=1 Tax=Apiospora marii TaxID=335849 RepID=A0ABR1R5M0_9PEZI
MRFDSLTATKDRGGSRTGRLNVLIVLRNLLHLLLRPLLPLLSGPPPPRAPLAPRRAGRAVLDRVDGEPRHGVALDEGGAGAAVGLDGADERLGVAVDDARAAQLVLEIGRHRRRVRVSARRPGTHGSGGGLAGALEDGRAQFRLGCGGAGGEEGDEGGGGVGEVHIVGCSWVC